LPPFYGVEIMVTRLWRGFGRMMKGISTITGYFSGVLVVVSAGCITYEVIWRYYLVRPHTWSMEANIFLLIAATFLASSFTQLKRGHIGTEVLDLVLPASWVPWRVLFGDILSFAICGFLSIRVGLYGMQAWSEGWTTDSIWAPHLWIPFALIAIGMLLTALQYLIQIVEQISHLHRKGDSCGRADTGVSAR
jgi:TRAP-type C4-dicarboxylate transport system permease small subunit